MKQVHAVANVARRIVQGAVFVVSFIALGSVAHAATAGVCGTIKSGITGQPLGNVQVAVTRPGTETTVGLATSSSNGAYCAPAKSGPGVYDVHFTPQLGVLQPKLEANFTIGTATTLNEVLDTTTQTLSGNVTDAQSDPAADVQFIFKNSGGETFTATTDTNGAYSIDLPNNEPFTIQAVDRGATLSISSGITLNGDATRDFQLPAVAILQVQLTDVTGKYPSGTFTVASHDTMSADQGGDTYTQTYPGFTQQLDLPSTQALAVLAGATFARDDLCFDFTEARVCNPSDVTVDSDTPLQLQSLPRYTLTGTVVAAQGSLPTNLAIIPNIATDAWSPDVRITDPAAYDQIQPDADGNFSIEVPATTYTFQFINSMQYPAITAQIDVTMNADLTHTFQLPALRTITAYTVDNTGAPLNSSYVQLVTTPANTQSGGDTYQVSSYGAFGGNESVSSIQVFDGTTVDPSDDNFYAAFGDGEQIPYPFSGPLVVSGDMNLTFQASATKPTAPTNLTGTTPTTDYPTLSWTAAAGAPDGTVYTVYRDQGQEIGTTTDTSMSDNVIELDPGVHTYYVQASVDGLLSDFSNTVTIDYEPAQ